MWSPRGIDNEGFTLKILLAQGSYRYLSGTTLTRGTYSLASLMPGWKFKHGAWDITVMAGPDFQLHSFTPDDLTNDLRGQHLGLRGGIDVWWQRSASTMMQASLSASSLGASYSGRIAGGWRMMEKFWIGPEFIVNGDRTYQQYRLGAHVTSLIIGTIETTFAMGYARDSDVRSGLYGRFGFIMKR